jgi:chromosome segregation ATPase
MNDTEKDPRRCRELRQIELTIENSRVRAKNNWDRARGYIASQRAQRSALVAKLSELRNQLTTKLALSALKGPAGLAASIEVGRFEIKIAKVKADIEAINQNIRTKELELQRFLNEIQHWNRSLDQNAGRMSTLNCVLP